MAIVKENIILNGLIKSGLIKDSLINQSEDSVVTEAPSITGIFDILDGEYLEEYTLNLNVLNTGGKAASWEWAGIGVPPSWATLNNNGVITGIAAVGTWSDYSVKAINAIGSSISNVDSVTISAPAIPELTGTFDLIDGTVGSQYTFDCNTLNTGGTVESWAFSGTYPEWVSLDANTGIITGVAAEGSWSGYAVTATNITGVSPSNTDSIDIFASIVFSGIFDMVDVTVGDSYNYDVSSLFSSGGVVTSYEFTGTPPTGASISSSGLITGTAEEGAWAGYSVKATNLAGSVFSNTDSIEVSASLTPPIASGTFNPPDGEIGVAYSYATAFIFTGGAVVSYSISGTLPDGLTIDSGTGVISGTPTVSSDFTNIAVIGTNTDGSDTSNTADINIPVVLAPPVASGVFNPPDIAEGGAYSYATAFIFTGGAVTSYSINGTLPAGLAFNTSSGLISGTATTAGISSGLSITGTNTDGSDTSNTADIEVTAVVSTVTFIAAKEALTDVQNVDAEGNIMNLMPKGDITATSTHSTTVLAPDKDGVYREYAVDAPVWKGGSYISNSFQWSEDITQIWSETGLGVTVEDSETLSFTSANDNLQQTILISGGTNGIDTVVSAVLWVDSGTTQVRFKSTHGGVADYYSTDITITDVPTRYHFGQSFTTADGSGSIIAGIRSGTSSGNITIKCKEFQLETGKLTPGPYVKTESIAPVVNTYYDNLDVYAQTNKADTNRALGSNSLIAPEWTVAGAGTTADVNQIGLTGEANTATLITVDGLDAGVAGVNQPLMFKSGDVEGSIVIYIKNIDAIYLCVRMLAEDNLNRDIWFDLANKNVSSAQSEITGEVIDLGNGIIKCIAHTEWVNGGAGRFDINLSAIDGDKGQGNTAMSCTILNAEVHIGKTILEVRNTPPIFTTTAAASIPALSYTYPAANINPNPELLTNGTFDTGIDNWGVARGATLSHEANALRVHFPDPTNWAAGTQGAPTVVGETYYAEVDVVDTVGVEAYFLKSDSADNHVNKVNSPASTANKLSITFVATATTSYIWVGASVDDAVANSSALFDNVSLRLADINDADIGIKIDYQGDDTDVIDIGGNKLLTVGNIADGNELVDVIPVTASDWNAYGINTIEDDTENSVKLTYVDSGNGAFIYLQNATILNTDLSLDDELVFTCMAKGNLIEGAAPRIVTSQGITEATHDITTTDWQQVLFQLKVVNPGLGEHYIKFGNLSVGEIVWIKDMSVQYAEKGIKLSDGTNELTQAISEGSNQIDVTLTATAMQLTAGGVKQNGPYTPIAAGLITVSEDYYALTRDVASLILPDPAFVFDFSAVTGPVTSITSTGLDTSTTLTNTDGTTNIAVAAKNGLNAAVFTGANALSGAITSALSTFSAYIVIRTKTGSGANTGVFSVGPTGGSDWDNTNGINLCGYGSVDTKVLARRGSSGDILDMRVTHEPDLFKVYELHVDVTNGVAKMNYGEATELTDIFDDNALIDPDVMVIGARFNGGGIELFGTSDVGEIRVYSTYHSAEEAVVARQELYDKWAITDGSELIVTYDGEAITYNGTTIIHEI